MINHNKNKNKGFTLIEIIVSVGLFALVLIVILGALFTVIDVNKKSQTLTSVMTNLNFALESMTRDIKTSDSFTVGQDQSEDFGDRISIQKSLEDTDNVFYGMRRSDETGNNYLYKRIGSNEEIELTSNQEVNILDFSINQVGGVNGGQPSVIILVRGEAKIGPKIKSDFNLQTSVSRRKLEISN